MQANQIDHASRAKLLELGIYFWYLRPSQLQVYEFLKSHWDDSPFIEASRRWGKTTSILIYVLELLRLNPGWVCRWCLPDKDQAREIVTPEVEKIQWDCPEHLKFTFYSTDHSYVGPNGSRLYLCGVNKDRGRSARGPFAHLIVADEFGYWQHVPDIEAGLKPQLLTTRGQWIYASTPPEDLGHTYYTKKREAERAKLLISRTIHDNESLRASDIAKAAKDCGGFESPTFRREYLCEEIGDPTKRVVPEYDEEFNDLEDSHPRPSFFDAFVGGDSGADDNTAILFGYYDFVNDWLVIEDEIVLSGRTTKAIIELAKAKELELWGKKVPMRRVYDADKQLLIDITSTYGYSVYLPEKADRIAGINGFRVKVGAGKVKIKKKCQILRRQLAVGQWRDDKHTDFLRKDTDDTLKHLDAIAAVVYLHRSIPQHPRNPYPQHEGVSLSTHFIGDELVRGEVSEDEALANLFSSPLGSLFHGR